MGLLTDDDGHKAGRRDELCLEKSLLYTSIIPMPQVATGRRFSP